MRIHVSLLAFAALVLVPALAAPQVLTNCLEPGTVSYDDGLFESGTGFNEANVARGAYAMKFDAPFLPAQLKSVCICWVRDSADSSITFNLNVWDGSGSAPGALLGRVTGLQATGVTNSVASAQFRQYDLVAAGIVVNGPVFIGPDWNARTDVDFFLCQDDGFQPARAGFICGSSQDAPCTPNLNLLLGDPLYEALGIRAAFETPTSGCIPTDTALCLNKGRFKVEATFNAPNQPPNQVAQVVKLTDETGYLYFFSPQNVEAVVKILDACGFNQRFWVFAGGLTDVNVVLTVTDTKNGTVKTYTNPQGRPFQPIQDAGAFATCP